MPSLLERLERLSPAQRALLARRLAERQGPDPAARPRLVGYLVAGDAYDEAALTAHLRARLPDHMVPTAFVCLDALPRLPNGKVNRHALPFPLPDAAAPIAPAPPRTPTERQLAALWAAVLRHDTIGIHDDFFALGGDSLLAVDLFARIDKHFGKRLPLATLFERPTVARLAAALTADDFAPTWTSLVPIHPEGAHPPLFCIHAGGGHVLFYHPLAQRLAPEVPVYGLEPLGLRGDHAPLRRVEAIAAHYLGEVRAVQPTGPYHLLVRCASTSIGLEMARQLAGEGETVAFFGVLDSALSAPQIEDLVRMGSETYVGRKTPPDGFAATVAHQVEKRVRRLRKRVARRRRDWFGDAREQALDRVQTALIEANRAYVPRPHRGPITLFRSQEFADRPDKDYHVEEWAALASDGLATPVLPVRHITMAEEPEVAFLADHLRAVLASSSS